MEAIREISIKIRVRKDTYERIKLISTREARTITNVLQLAVEETADRGYTDKVNIKGRI